MSTCVETQTAGLHQLDNMTGLQKHPRTKAAASRYIVFHHACFFLNFLQDFENTMLSESNVFLFFTQPSSLDSPGYQSAFPGPSSTRLSGDFLSRAVSHALPRLYHVICPPVTGFHPKARRNMACGRYVQQITSSWNGSNGSKPENTKALHCPLKTFKMTQSSVFPHRSIPP
jgi:hypothetical protein